MSEALTPLALHVDALARWLLEDPRARASLCTSAPDPEVTRRLGVIARRMRDTQWAALRAVVARAQDIVSQEGLYTLP